MNSPQKSQHGNMSENWISLELLTASSFTTWKLG